MSVYPATTLRQARAFMVLEDWTIPSPDGVSDFFAVRGNGSDEVWDAIENLADGLESISSGDSLKPSFDAEAREIVHRHLAQLDDDVVSDADFWRFLSAVRFRDIVAMRHPVTRKSFTGEGVNGNWANFGALRSDVRESLFFRLFVGAELALDAGNLKDPYHLAKIHDVDLWQSHIVRVFSGDNPEYARSLLRWFRDRQAWYATYSQANVQDLFARFDDAPETRHLRDLVKRVRRIRSNIVHEFLTESEVLYIVEHEALESLKNIEFWGVARSKKRRAAESE
jgi:hypothetical protein